MTEKMWKFPSIEQFRSVIHQVNHKSRIIGSNDDGTPIMNRGEVDMPTLTFKGTVKMHGTNAGIVYTWNMLKHDYDMHVQSRNNVITPVNDNAGFATFIHNVNTESLLNLIEKGFGSGMGYTPDVVRVYGEWCGGNIQKGVGVSGLDKMFVIFAIKIDNVWLSDDMLKSIKLEGENVYNILDYPTYTIDINFNDPKDSINEMVELVNKIEDECPVAKHHGNSGIGEGIVFRCINEGWTSSRFWFKAKGGKHQSSKTKTIVSVDIERVNNIKELVDNFLTESRLNQGLEVLKEGDLEITRKNIGTYLKWIVGDIMKEELDTIIGNGFEPKELKSVISNKARTWFFDVETKLAGL